MTVSYSGGATPIISSLSTTFVELRCPKDKGSNNSDSDGGATTGNHDEEDDDGGTERRLVWGVCETTGTAAKSTSATSSASVSLTTTSLSGVQFILHTKDDLTWMVFSSEPVTLNLDADGRRVRAGGEFAGVLRLALIPPEESEGGGGKG